MQRDLDAFNREFDVLVIGGGVYGACIARLAAGSGLAVALLERGDFGAAVSHNSLKIIHGGFRYIQHLDLSRIRESVAAQRFWLRAAPHLVRPMRCVIPAYGYGTRGPAAFLAGVCAFHMVAPRRNRALAAAVRLPWSGVLSRRALLSMYPQLDSGDLTGGAYWYDAQMLDANRLTLECLQDACDHGAVVANHVEVLHLCSTGRSVEGGVARDGLTGREFEVRARVTINATGPHVEKLLQAGPRPITIGRPLVWTRNVNLVTRRLIDTCDAVGVGSQRPSDAAIGQSKRLFFVTPWQDCSVIGTSHTRHEGQPDEIREDVGIDVGKFLTEVNEALPRMQLGPDDVRYVHSGLTPAEDDVARAKRSIVIDHGQQDGVQGLITVLGIKYTTAPTVAAAVMPLIQHLARITGPDQQGAFPHPLPGGVGYSLDKVRWLDEPPQSADSSWARRIYGARAQQLFGTLQPGALTEAEHVFRCRVLFGIRSEMVIRLRDAIFRATDLAERGRLTAVQLNWCADALATTFNWSPARRQEEYDSVIGHLRLRDPGSRL